jgi:hypothetical protein
MWIYTTEVGCLRVVLRGLTRRATRHTVVHVHTLWSVAGLRHSTLITPTQYGGPHTHSFTDFCVVNTIMIDLERNLTPHILRVVQGANQ